MTLADYQTATARILRDSGGTLYAPTDLVAFINEARRRRDLQSGRVRAVFGLSLTANLSTYLLSNIAASTFIRGEATGIPKNVVSLHVIVGGVAGGGGLRYPLARKPYSMVAWLISTAYPSYPAWYANYGTKAFVLGPMPAQAYGAEWDCKCIYPSLVNASDVEPMDDPWNDPVPYLAAAIAKRNAQRYDEAASFENDYNMSLRTVRDSIFDTIVADPWTGIARGRGWGG